MSSSWLSLGPEDLQFLLGVKLAPPSQSGPLHAEQNPAPAGDIPAQRLTFLALPSSLHVSFAVGFAFPQTLPNLSGLRSSAAD